MLYMCLLSWDPKDRNTVIERTKKLGFAHEGMKTLGTWVDPAGSRGYQLVDMPNNMDPAVYMKNLLAWNDIIKIENIAVVEGGEMMKAMSSMK